MNGRRAKEWMGGWIDEGMDEGMGGWMDGRKMDKWMDGRWTYG